MLIMCIMMKFVEEWDFPILYIIKTIFISIILKKMSHRKINIDLNL